MSLVIRKHSHTRASTAQISRGIAKLSDGKFAVLFYNSNITGKSGSSSEKNNTAKLYVTVYNSDWSAFKTVSFAVSGAKSKHVAGQVASMAIDSSNNIHVVYNYRTSPDNSTLKSQGQTLRYRKVTYDGTALTVGAETSLVTTASVYYPSVDIDVPLGTTLNDKPVIAYTQNNGTDSKVYLFQYGSSNTLVATVNGPASRGVSFGLNNASGVTNYTWLLTHFQQESGDDYGDAIIHGTGTTTSSPTVSAALASGLNIGQGEGMRALSVFREGNVFIVTGPISVATYSQLFAAYRLPVGGAAAILQSPYTISVNTPYDRKAGYHNFSASQIDPANNAIITHLYYKKNIYANVYSYVLASDESSITFVRQSNTWKMDTQYLGKNVEPSSLMNGDRARVSSVDIKCVVNVPEAYLYILYRRVPTGGLIKAALSTPAAGGVVNTSSPKITATVTGSSNNNIVGCLQIQTSPNSSFSSGVQNFYSDYQTFLKSVSVTIQVPASGLDQGMYYSRLRVVDNVGYAYDWNPTQTFTVSHKPVANIIKPNHGQVAIFNSDNTVSFQLGFSDTDPNDFASAHRLIVSDLNGTVVADTGKVISTALAFDVAIPVGSVDGSLLLSAYVWDSDDVMSSEATGDFYLANPPTLSIDGPDAYEVVLTATPIVSWAALIPGTRTQASYRVMYRKVDGTLVWDSRVIVGDDNAYVTPSGKLKNDTTYIVTVTITDSIGMSVSATQTFTTGWAKPSPCAAPFVDLSLYDTLGFAYITIVPPALDAATIPHAQVVLMRRSIFSNDNWEEVGALQMGAGLNYSLLDSSLPAGVDNFYAVVLHIDTDGDIAVGDPDASAYTKVSTPASSYWLVNQDDASKNFRLHGITADTYTDEFEQETYTIANRGRWQDIGEHLGYNGTLTMRIVDRDVNLGGNPVSNFLLNPRMLFSGSGIPKWTLTNAAILKVTTKSPCPIGKSSNVALSKTGASDAVIEQTVPVVAAPMTASFWLETSLIPVGAGKSITIGVKFKDSSGTQLANQSLTYNLYAEGSAMRTGAEPDSVSIINSIYDWYRLDVPLVPPSGSVSANIYLSYAGGTGDFLTLGGAMLYDSTNTKIKFFDGNTVGAEWFGEENLTKSFSAGKLSARLARRRLLSIASGDDQYFLRNPFGDVFLVSPGNIQVERMAGTGQNEFVSATIPYMELGQ